MKCRQHGVWRASVCFHSNYLPPGKSAYTCFVHNFHYGLSRNLVVCLVIVGSTSVNSSSNVSIGLSIRRKFHNFSLWSCWRSRNNLYSVSFVLSNNRQKWTDSLRVSGYRINPIGFLTGRHETSKRGLHFVTFSLRVNLQFFCDYCSGF